MLVQQTKVSAGIDIGGTNTLIGFVTENGEILNEISFLTNDFNDPEHFFSKVKTEVSNFLNNFSATLIGIGIAAPSVNNLTGIIDTPSNLKWGSLNIVERIKKDFHLPVMISNDANAAALGEKNYGSAKGIKNFIVVTLGTGLGSGLVLDGNIVYGENGLAGELGHTIIIPGGRKCNCGRLGCLETYVSGNGLKRTAFELLVNQNDDSKLREIPFNNINGETLYDLALQDDPVALKSFIITGEYLGKALANLIACFSSELIILTGGLMNAGALILDPAKYHFENNLLAIYKDKTRIIKSVFNSKVAAVLGVSSLVLNNLNSKSSFAVDETISS